MHYTVLTLHELNQIANQYNIGAVESYKVLSGGSENTNYLIKTVENSYVLTICEQKTKVEAEHLAKLLKHLNDNKFTTSKIVLDTKGELITVYNGKPLMIKTFLEGDIIDNLPINLLELLGVELGKLHKIASPKYVEEHLSYGIENFGKVSEYALNSEYHQWLQEQELYIRHYINSTLPKTLIHSDVFSDNVIVNKEKTAVFIMDFEEAAYYYRIFDVGMTIIGVCREGTSINLKKVEALLKGYYAEIQLQEHEVQALKPFTVYAATAMSFWRHRNFNFVNPNPKLKSHYLELKMIADSIRQLPEDSFTVFK